LVIQYMRHYFGYISFPKRSYCSIAVALLCSTMSSAYAQSLPTGAGNNVPPPPLSVSSPYGKTKRGSYVLPGTRSPSSNKLPPLPKETSRPPVRLSSDPLPSPRLLTRSATGDLTNAPMHRAVTPSTMRYASPAKGSTYYPKPHSVAPQASQVSPAPLQVQPVRDMIQQSAPMPAAAPQVPFGKPSKPLQQEQRILVGNTPRTPEKAPIVATPPPMQPQRIAEPQTPQLVTKRIIPDRQSTAAAHPMTQTSQPVEQAESRKHIPWNLEMADSEQPPVFEPMQPTPAPAPVIAQETPFEPVLAPYPAPVLPADEPQQDVNNEFNAIIRNDDIAKESSEAPMPAAPDDVIMPLEGIPVQSIPTAPVDMAELPELSPESRKILSKTPSGIDSKVIAHSPEPVIIKRTDPNAGNIPKIDVRTHEEMGMKIEVRKANINVHEYLEQGYENLMDGHEAIAAGYYNEALKAEPKNELALFGLATTHQRMGNRDEARELYGRLLAINPTHREALNNFMALISDEAPEDAIEELEKLETENPDFSPIPAQLGVVYKKLGDNRMAVNKLVRALQLSPDNVSYKYNLAITLDAMGDTEEASDLYMELIEDYNNGATLPGDVETIRNRAIFLNAKR
jgi:Flp pilus assembly protein TadD